jgi:hypothetical protein
MIYGKNIDIFIGYKKLYKVCYMAIGIIYWNDILMPTAGGTLNSFYAPPYDRPQNDHTVAEFYFLSLVVTSGIIMYGDFPYWMAPAKNFAQ